MLIEISHKWHSVGLQLNVKPSVLKRIRSQYSDPVERLCEMLSEWLSGIDPYPTWEALARALESRSVSEGRLAAKVRGNTRESIPATLPTALQNPSAHLTPPLRPTPSHIHVVEVSTPPQPQRPPTHAPLPPYTPAPQMHPVDQYANYLRAYYEGEKLPVYSKWPPTASKKYIHLAVVKKKHVTKREADVITRATLYGNIDEIIGKKERLEFTQIGIKQDGSHARMILVEGAPGIGKTTFSWELGRRWSERKILQWYRLVVLLRLRDRRVREAKTIYDLLYYSDDEVRIDVAKEVTRNNGKSVLLLFEGFDELPRKLQTEESIFLDILCRRKLPKATVLITSRPSATKFLHSIFKGNIDQHIEILGFTTADVQSYVQSVIEDEQLHAKFAKYLKCYPHIRGLMYVPLNAVIVTEIYKDTKTNESEEFVPTTLTELYTSLSRGMLLRYLTSHNEYGKQEWELTSFSDLPEELHKQLHTICGIAFKGILKDEFIFDGLAREFNTLDLMQSASELYVGKGAVVSHNFFHLTLQEFLAAVHVSQQPTTEQLQYFRQSTPAWIEQRERQEREQQERERQERERQERELQEREQQERERQERERQEREQQERERQERERQERERQEREQQERERQEREQQERGRQQREIQRQREQQLEEQQRIEQEREHRKQEIKLLQQRQQHPLIQELDSTTESHTYSSEQLTSSTLPEAPTILPQLRRRKPLQQADMHSSTPLSTSHTDIIEDFIQSIQPTEPLATTLSESLTLLHPSQGAQKPVVSPTLPGQLPSPGILPPQFERPLTPDLESITKPSTGTAEGLAFPQSESPPPPIQLSQLQQVLETLQLQGLLLEPESTMAPSTSTSAPPTILEPESTMEPSTSTSEPPTILEPESTMAPSTSTSAPPTILEPESTMEPSTSTSEPPTILEPESTMAPSTSTSEPPTILEPELTMAPSTSTSAPPTILEPESTMEPSTSTSEPPTILEPESTMAPSTSTSEPPTILEPESTVVPSTSTSEPPTILEPETTMAPSTSTSEPPTILEPESTMAPSASTSEHPTILEPESTVVPSTSTSEPPTILEPESTMAPSTSTSEHPTILELESTMAPSTSTSEHPTILEPESTMAPSTSTSEPPTILEPESTMAPSTSTLEPPTILVPHVSELIETSTLPRQHPSVNTQDQGRLEPLRAPMTRSPPSESTPPRPETKAIPDMADIGRLQLETPQLEPPVPQQLLSQREIPRITNPRPVIPHTLPVSPPGGSLSYAVLTSSHFQNVVKFTAGLTKLKGIPTDRMKSILLQDRRGRQVIPLYSLHWLFEAQCISKYSEMIAETATLTFNHSYSDSSMTPFDCFVLGYALSHINSRWYINMWGSHIGDEGLEMMVAGMNYKEATLPPSLKSISLNLALCDISSVGLSHLKEMPEQVATRITELYLLGNRDISGVASLLSNLTSLKRLDLGETSISTQEVGLLAKLLSHSQPHKLEYLDLSDSLKSPESTSLILTALSNNTTLREINLTGAHVSENNLSLLTSALTTNTTLRKLDLSHCKINDNMVSEITSALCDNSTLQTLDLWGNAFGRSGATALAGMLRRNNTLQELYVRRNTIGEEGTLKLATSLEHNKTLKKLVIDEEYEHSLPPELLLKTKYRIAFYY